LGVGVGGTGVGVAAGPQLTTSPAASTIKAKATIIFLISSSF
jgi:hypothetical protein